MQTEIRAPGSSRRILLGASSLFLSCLLASGVAGAGAAAQSGTSRYIVQGPDAEVVAERIRALGVAAPGTYREFAKLTVIKESEGKVTAEEMIKQLVAGQEAVVKTARGLFPLVDKVGDEPTADLLTQRMQIHEKNAWMLRSLLEA